MMPNRTMIVFLGVLAGVAAMQVGVHGDKESDSGGVLTLLHNSNTMLPKAFAAENLFYGSSSFEDLSSVPPETNMFFDLNVGYENGPAILRAITPVIQVYPESARQFVTVDYDLPITLRSGSQGTISGTLRVDDGLPEERIFLSVYFVATDDVGNNYESGWIDTIYLDILRTGNTNSQPRTPSVPTSSLSPLKQFESGVESDQISCKNGFVIVVKASNGHPACVSPETKIKLQERGWIQ